jgi:Zn-dependent protease
VLLTREPTIELFIALGLILFVALPFHEFAHALAAYRLGDPTAKFMGRLTLNPLAHLDPVGALLIVLVGFGWAKPTPYNPLNVQGGRNGEAIIAFAGPASNLVLATAGAIPLRFITASDVAVPAVVTTTLALFVFINVLLMIFNLLPIPPLDGSKVLFALMDRRTEMQWRPVLEQYGIIILLGAMLLPILPGGQTLTDVVFREIADPLFGLLVGRNVGV